MASAVAVGAVAAWNTSLRACCVSSSTLPSAQMPLIAEAAMSGTVGGIAGMSEAEA
eukprot:CAMPEP_0180683480 /NCGR_PEP_ID=MMETSP1037_2-20121125/71192_1 /TAXON_ID=632150 /ORGANISM="Azadinium spinosum, Strain 3D9" /LENGTH=55 /DNA_ID=CAMNT_0022713701 /DNA_START=177 /DNA_END=340 /DNA_ORIENTATION=+